MINGNYLTMSHYTRENRFWVWSQTSLPPDASLDRIRGKWRGTSQPAYVEEQICFNRWFKSTPSLPLSTCTYTIVRGSDKIIAEEPDIPLMGVTLATVGGLTIELGKRRTRSSASSAKLRR
jgi:hypothetical protein